MLRMVNPRGRKKRFDRAIHGPFRTDKKDIKHTNVYYSHCDITGHPVCPFCGVYNASTVDYGRTPPERIHLGQLEYTVVCHNDNTLFRYYRDISWR